MTDYWLSKMFYDLQRPGAGAEYRADREKVLARYPLSPEVLAAIRADDVAALAPRVNAYLLRFYFGAAGMTDDVFVAKLHAMQEHAAGKEQAHG
jgi:Aromatic-ring-opening dioxygenase LigAB, LigA subunit